MPIRVSISCESPDLIPEYATTESAGMDLRANEDATLQPGERAAVGTGIRLEIPPGYEAQVRPRSGLALKHGISIPNAPGTIDADYRGEVKVILINLGDAPFDVHRGDRIAQLVFAKVENVEWNIQTELAESVRGEGGFGSTGAR